MNDQKSGYDCEFKEKPQKQFPSECPICLLVLREPYQATCCGSPFCQVCIEQIQKENKPCPSCKAESFTTFQDKGKKNSLYAFEVHCSNTQQGCQWVGELGQLDNHLNLNPEQHNQLQGCQLSQIKCLHCYQLFLRSDIQAHQNDQCPKRPFSCQYCKNFDSCYEEVATNHWPVCGSYPMPCTNKCGHTLQRQNLQNHIDRHCPLTKIKCEFQSAGCEVKLFRKDMAAHYDDHEALVTHVSLLKKQVEDLKRDIRTIACQYFIMDEFEQRKLSGEPWTSVPFYSHPHGYKLHLIVYANGTREGAGSHVSVMLKTAKGEYDKYLLWPCQCSAIVAVVNIQNEHEKKLVCKRENALQRVKSGTMSKTGSGDCKFISHTLVNDYLRNDSLHFQVYDIQVSM